MTKHTFDVPLAHKHFAADCFNRAWSLIDKPARTADEDDEMLLLALASLWHWSQREDRTDQNLSVGHWLVSRVYTLLGKGMQARKHAEQSLSYALDAPPFYRGYAHEALARAAVVNDDPAAVREHLIKARTLLAQVDDAEDRQALETDLASLESHD